MISILGLPLAVLFQDDASFLNNKKIPQNSLRYFTLRILVDISDDHIFGATFEDVVDLAFKRAGESNGLEVFAACESVGADFGYGRGDRNGFKGLASPECHFADAFKTFGKVERGELGAEGERLLCDFGHACGNGNGFEFVLEAEDTLTYADLKNGAFGAVFHCVFGIKNDSVGCFILFPVEDRNADNFIGVLVFDGSDDVIVVKAVDELGVNENNGTLGGGFGCGGRSFGAAGAAGCFCCGSAGGIICGSFFVSGLARYEESRSHTDYEEQSNNLFHKIDHTFRKLSILLV